MAGFKSRKFSLSRGVWQRWSPLPLLFNITMETLAIDIRSRDEIKAWSCKHKLLFYADDVVLMLKDSLGLFENFEYSISSV